MIIKTEIKVRGDPEKYPASFYMRPADGAWKIYEVEAGNIQIMENYRAQFGRVIRNEGFNALLELLWKNINSVRPQRPVTD